MPLNNKLLIYEYLWYPYDVHIPTIMGGGGVALWMTEHTHINNLCTGGKGLIKHVFGINHYSEQLGQ